jgi:hypothetical protein
VNKRGEPSHLQLTGTQLSTMRLSDSVQGSKQVRAYCRDHVCWFQRPIQKRLRQGPFPRESLVRDLWVVRKEEYRKAGSVKEAAVDKCRKSQRGDPRVDRVSQPGNS